MTKIEKIKAWARARAKRLAKKRDDYYQNDLIWNGRIVQGQISELYRAVSKAVDLLR